jgi:hypothetical protein
VRPAPRGRPCCSREPWRSGRPGRTRRRAS